MQTKRQPCRACGRVLHMTKDLQSGYSVVKEIGRGPWEQKNKKQETRNERTPLTHEISLKQKATATSGHVQATRQPCSTSPCLSLPVRMTQERKEKEISGWCYLKR